MSILNRPSDGLFNVLIVLIRCSMMLGTMPRSKLLDLCAPKSLGDGKQGMATKTVNRWVELGLFELSEKEDIKIADQFRSELKKKLVQNSAIASCLRQIVLAKENNQHFWEEEANKAADFNRAAAWMLAQDVYRFSPSSYKNEVEPKLIEQIVSSNIVIFQNGTRWDGFVSWSTFLGFGHPDSGKASAGYNIDPTPVIRGTLLDLLPKKGHVAISNILDELAARIPVIDGGEYRLSVEEKLRAGKWRPTGVSELSMSLSRSLIRLQEAGVIRLERKSDAEVQVKLLGRDHREIDGITHIRRGDAK